MADQARLPDGTTAAAISRSCFVIGPFGEENTAIRKWSDSLLTEVIRPIATEHGYQAHRSIDQVRPRDITSDLVSQLLLADLVVADLTSANANVYYELAIRHAIQRPFIHVIQGGEQPPFDIKNLDVLSLPTKKTRRGIKIPDGPSCMERLRPYFKAVLDGKGSYASILAGEQIGKTLREAFEKISPNQISRMPQILKQSIFKYAYGLPLYYRSFEYDIELTHADGKVTYHMNVVFDLVNVSSDAQTVVNRYPTPTRDFQLQAASIDHHLLDLHDPSLYGGDAITLKYTIPQGQSTRFGVLLAKSFSEQDSDFFTAYLYPSETFRFRVKNRSPDSLMMWLEMLHSQNALPKRDGDTITWEAADPLLPNQGIRLLWRLKDGNQR